MVDKRAFVLLIPISMGAFLILGTIGWYAAVQVGGTARGGSAKVTFDSACGTDAMTARLADYGLSGAWLGPVLTMQLPGLEDDKVHMPAALTLPGTLTVTTRGAAQPVTMRHGGVQLSMGGNPVSLFTLDTALDAEGLVVVINGETVDVEAVNGGELQIPATAADGPRALRLATDRVVSVRHPLPCQVGVVSVE